MIKEISYVGMVRNILSERLAEGRAVSTQKDILEALSVLPEEKGRVYEAIRQLKRRGEVRVEDNGLRYQPEEAPDHFSDRIYRVIRAFKGGFTVEQIASTAELKPERVRNVIGVLAGAGYLTVAGKNGSSRVWQVTQKCRDSPAPPRLKFSQGAFMQERRAVAKLTEIFLSATDLSGSRTSEIIREQLEILNRRFARKGVGHVS